MSRWFRFHAEAMRNPKVARLSDKEFRLWVELLSVASENGGAIPCLEDLKHLLKRRLDHLSTGVQRLISLGLIDLLADGYEPHNWSKFQYKSDVSTERVHKHRAKRNVSETPPDTEADTETEVVGSNEPTARAKPNAFPRPSWAEAQSWKDFLKNREKKRHANTATAHAKFLRDMEKLTDDEWPPGRLLEAIVARGWAAAYDPRESRSNGLSPRQSDLRQASRGERPNRCLDMLATAEAEIRAGENPEPDLPPRLALRAV